MERNYLNIVSYEFHDSLNSSLLYLALAKIVFIIFHLHLEYLQEKEKIIILDSKIIFPFKTHYSLIIILTLIWVYQMSNLKILFSLISILMKENPLNFLIMLMTP